MPDVYALVNRIRALDARMHGVKAKSDIIMTKRREVTLETANSIIRNFIGIRDLMIACQCDEFDPAWNEPKEVLEGMLQNCHFTRDSIVPTETQVDTLCIKKHSLPEIDTVASEEPDIESTDELDIITKADPNQSLMQMSFQHSYKQPGFHPMEAPTPPCISDEDFQAIPAHIRGRCSLPDVQRVLQKLREGFQKHLAQQSAHTGTRRKKKSSAVGQGGRGKGSAPALSEFSMTVQQLEATGCKVCGQTGLCVLKTLQKMGYIDLAKRGDVVTLMHAGCDDIIFGAAQSNNKQIEQQIKTVPG